MRGPRISGVTADWAAATATILAPAPPEAPKFEAQKPDAPKPAAATSGSSEPGGADGKPTSDDARPKAEPDTNDAPPVDASPAPPPATRVAVEVPAEPLARINDANAQLIPTIAASAVPVLLPLDTAALQRDRAAGTLLPLGDYLAGFKSMPFFQGGPGGYDAVFSVHAPDLPSLGIRFAERIDIHVSGSALLYELDEPKGMANWPVNGLANEFPGIRRLYLESIVRYAFVRYSVPYVVSILCVEGRSRGRRISCRDADKVATMFLRALRVAGGTPISKGDADTAERVSATIEANTIAQPEAVSDVFTYYAPGDIITGSGFKGQRGRADYTVYSRMRFPLAETPAFANSQSFMNFGDCDQTGRVIMGRRGSTPAYRCQVNGQMLIADESAADNYAYPWRDNFCEHRYFDVGECPGGFGHQGQDIRPSSCTRAPGASRCDPYLHNVVAARDGMILRSPGQTAAFYVVTNAPNERVRFRYLHMHPRQLDESGVLSGRVVREGEVLGKVGNFFQHERATTYHLHFDMQVPTKYGWVFVNPYMSLVAAYERQIGARGREIHELKDLPEAKDNPDRDDAAAAAADAMATVSHADGAAGPGAAPPLP